MIGCNIDLLTNPLLELAGQQYFGGKAERCSPKSKKWRTKKSTYTQITSLIAPLALSLSSQSRGASPPHRH